MKIGIGTLLRSKLNNDILIITEEHGEYFKADPIFGSGFLLRFYKDTKYDNWEVIA